MAACAIIMSVANSTAATGPAEQVARIPRLAEDRVRVVGQLMGGVSAATRKISPVKYTPQLMAKCNRSSS